MITGELRSKVDRIWDTMWSGGISNPLSVIKQLTYLLFIKRLDELHTLRERKAARTGLPIEDPVFTADQDHLRWSRFKEAAPMRRSLSVVVVELASKVTSPLALILPLSRLLMMIASSWRCSSSLV